MKKDKSLIISKLKSHYGFKRDKELADFLGIKPQTLSSWYARNTIDYDLLYAKCVDISMDWLISGKGSMIRGASIPAEGIPLIPADAIAGKQQGELVIRDADIEERYVVPDFAKADFLIRVKGSSMYPKYSAGDILACKKVSLNDFIQWNKTYVIDTTQGILVKRILKGKNGRWLLRSDNRDYQDIEVDPAKDINHINLVLGVIRLE